MLYTTVSLAAALVVASFLLPESLVSQRVAKRLAKDCQQVAGMPNQLIFFRCLENLFLALPVIRFFFSHLDLDETRDEILS